VVTSLVSHADNSGICRTLCGSTGHTCHGHHEHLGSKENIKNQVAPDFNGKKVLEQYQFNWFEFMQHLDENNTKINVSEVEITSSLTDEQK